MLNLSSWREEKLLQRKKRLVTTMVVISIITWVILSCFYMIRSAQYHSLVNFNSEWSKKISSLEQLIVRQKKEGGRQKEIEFKFRFLQRQQQILSVINTIIKILPSNSCLNSLVFANNQLLLSGILFSSNQTLISHLVEFLKHNLHVAAKLLELKTTSFRRIEYKIAILIPVRPF